MEIKVCNNVEVGSSLVCLENSGIQKDMTGDRVLSYMLSNVMWTSLT